MDWTDWAERVKDDINAAFLWILAGVVTAGLWVVRTVLTDRARVNAIENSIGEIQKNVRLLTGAMLDTKAKEEQDE